jgi:uncharacterized membrane protein
LHAKTPIWVYLGWPWNGKCCHTYVITVWNSLGPFAIFYGHLVHFVVIEYIFSRFGMFLQKHPATPETEDSLQQLVHFCHGFDESGVGGDVQVDASVASVDAVVKSWGQFFLFERISNLKTKTKSQMNLAHHIRKNVEVQNAESHHF